LIGIVLSIVLALISNNFNIKNKSLYE